MSLRRRDSMGSTAGVNVARQYRIAGYLAETTRLHVAVEFDRSVAGPIAIGRSRHVGFGPIMSSPLDRQKKHAPVPARNTM